MISLSLLLLLLALLPSLPLLGAGVSSSTLLSPSLQFGDHLCYVKHHVFTWGDKHRVLFSLQPHVGRMNPVRSQTQQDEPCQESDSAGWTLSGVRLSRMNPVRNQTQLHRLRRWFWHHKDKPLCFLCVTYGRWICPDTSCRQPASPGLWLDLWTGRLCSTPWGASCSAMMSQRCHFNPHWSVCVWYQCVCFSYLHIDVEAGSCQDVSDLSTGRILHRLQTHNVTTSAALFKTCDTTSTLQCFIWEIWSWFRPQSHLIVTSQWVQLYQNTQTHSNCTMWATEGCRALLRRVPPPKLWSRSSDFGAFMDTKK